MAATHLSVHNVLGLMMKYIQMENEAEFTTRLAAYNTVST
jgi:hypothetical protein